MDVPTTALRRAYQQIALKAFIKSPERLWALLWERQAGKSSTLADFALYETLRNQNRTVIYGIASPPLAHARPKPLDEEMKIEELRMKKLTTRIKNNSISLL